MAYDSHLSPGSTYKTKMVGKAPKGPHQRAVYAAGKLKMFNDKVAGLDTYNPWIMMARRKGGTSHMR